MSSPVSYSSLPTYSTAGAGVLQRIQSRTSLIGPRRPWLELLAHPSSYSLPHGLPGFCSRFRRNLRHFRVNYVMIVLTIVFISLVYHPISMIVFLVMYVFWYFLYLTRDDPFLIFGRAVDDRVVLVVLGVVTAVALALTRVWLNVLVSVSIGVAAVAVHASLRKRGDLFLDEDEVPEGGLSSVVF